jgi:hypothetical protein
VDALAFLVIPVAVMVLGTIVIAIRSREPKSDDIGIKSFQKEMKALSPDGTRKSGPGEAGSNRPPGSDPLLPDGIATRPAEPPAGGESSVDSAESRE